MFDRRRVRFALAALPGKVVILYPPEDKSGKFIYPYSEIKR